MKSRESDKTPSRTRQRRATSVVLGGAVAIVFLLALSAWLLQQNAAAQMLLGVLVAAVSSGVSVYATRFYGARQNEAELTRYGLQAFRNLEYLVAKVARHLGSTPPDDDTLRSWLLDLDQGRLAWRELLGEVFDLQQRLQQDADEKNAAYLTRLAQIPEPTQREQLVAQHRAELAKIASKGPLPIDIPTQIVCPMCGELVHARLGQRPGDSSHPTCPKCGTAFPIHRLPDEEVKVGYLGGKEVVDIECPACESREATLMPRSQPVEFLLICKDCKTHLSVSGVAGDFCVEDQQEFNSSFECPACGGSTRVWISPARSRVSFLTRCEHCGISVQIEGSLASFAAEKREQDEA